MEGLFRIGHKVSSRDSRTHLIRVNVMVNMRVLCQGQSPCFQINPFSDFTSSKQHAFSRKSTGAQCHLFPKDRNSSCLRRDQRAVETTATSSLKDADTFLIELPTIYLCISSTGKRHLLRDNLRNINFKCLSEQKSTRIK